MKDFTYAAPTTTDEAAAALAASGARALAGGTDLIVQMREGRRAVGHVVDLKRVPELTAIAVAADGSLRFGAAASVAALAAHATVAAKFPAMIEAGRMIGSWQIQSRASLGGNICNASPSADAVPALMELGATAELTGKGGRRSLALEALILGPGKTALVPGEILAAIRVPAPAARSAAKYVRFTPRREMDIAVVGAGAWLRLAEDGSVAEARIALAAVGPTPLRATAAEKRLMGEKPTAALLAEAGRLAAADARPISDTRGSADYRRALVKVLAARALAGCCAQLGQRIEVP